MKQKTENKKLTDKKNRTITNSCSQCGICCRLFLINLTKQEWQSGLYKTQFEKFKSDNDFNIVQKYGGNILKQKKDGSCIYLKDNLCSIHKRRPKYCRMFLCSSKSKKYKSMIEIIKEQKRQE